MKFKRRNRYIATFTLFAVLLFNVIGVTHPVLAQEAINNLTYRVANNNSSVSISVENSVVKNDVVTITLYNKATNSLKFMDQLTLSNGQGTFSTVLVNGNYYGFARSSSDSSSVEISDFTVNSVPAPTHDTTLLRAVITSAQTLHAGATEGTAVGNYPAPAKATLQAAIDVANEVVSNAASTSQSAIDAAVATLNAAVTAFSNAKVVAPNTKNLTHSIAVNNNTVTISVTNTVVKNDAVTITLYNKTTGSLKFMDQLTLNNGQGTFSTVLVNGTYYGFVRSSSDSSSVAIGDFTVNSVPAPVLIKTALSEKIAEAQTLYDRATEGTAVGNYASGSKAALQTAIGTANTVLTNATTQASIDAAVVTLNTAITVFNNAKVTQPSNGGGGNGPTTPTTPTTPIVNTNPTEVANAIRQSTVKKVVVDITGNRTVGREIFEAIKGTDKTITFVQNGIEWSFNGADITGTTKAIDMTVKVAKLDSTTSDNKKEIKNKVNDKDVLVISFANNGQLPGKAKVRVKLDSAWLIGKNKNNMNIYYFNETTKAVETIASRLTVDAEGYVVFDITHNSDYIVSDVDLTKTTPIPEVPKPVATIRLGGANRYETSVKVSQAGWATADNVVLARGDEFADALSAAPLAKQLNAPILLTATKALDSSVIAELKRLKVKKVYIIGGTGAVSTAVENAVKKMGIGIERIAGSDRYATSLAIANKMTNKKQVFLATGTSFADTLSISSYAAATGSPILLTAKNQMTTGVAKFIKDNNSNVYVIGGTGVISEAAIKGISGAERISGADRYATNLAILKKFAAGFDFSNIYLATGANYPDAICGSALAGKENAPIILVNNSNATNQKTYVKSIIEKVSKVKILGGEGALPVSIIKNILN